MLFNLQRMFNDPFTYHPQRAAYRCPRALHAPSLVEQVVIMVEVTILMKIHLVAKLFMLKVVLSLIRQEPMDNLE